MKLLERIFQTIQLHLYKMSSRRKKEEGSINIVEKLLNAKNVLICMPPDESSAQSAQKSILNFHKKNPNRHITLLQNKTLSSNSTGYKSLKIIEYDDNDINSFGLPSLGLRNKVCNDKFDIVIDLCFSFFFINTALVWLSNAGLRVGFHCEEREELYNFLLRKNSALSTENAYRSLFNYLITT